MGNVISISLTISAYEVSEEFFDAELAGLKLRYQTYVYACYEESGCNPDAGDWVRVLESNTESVQLADGYNRNSERLEITLLGNTFQNQEALPTRSLVRSYLLVVPYSTPNLNYTFLLSNAEYEFNTIDKQSTFITDIFVVLFLIATLAVFCWYSLYLYRRHQANKEILPEQKWIVYYLAALILFQNPIYCVICWSERPNENAVFAYYIVDSLSQTSFYVIWLLFSDGLKRKLQQGWLFYLPKLAIGTMIFCANVVILCYQFPSVTVNMSRDPLLAVENWSSDTKSVFVAFSIAFLLLLWVWTIWWVLSMYFTGKALKMQRYMDTRYLQLSFRFFTLQATLVTLYYVFQYFVIIYFIISNSQDGWSDDLTVTADNINTLFRQQTSAFGKILFLSVYGVILCFFFLSADSAENKTQAMLAQTYVVSEGEMKRIVQIRRKIIKGMRSVGTLIGAKAEVYCVDLALELMEVSYEAYYDPSGSTTESGFGIMNLERCGYILIDMKYYEPLDTVCYICRNVKSKRLVVAFRYTARILCFVFVALMWCFVT